MKPIVNGNGYYIYASDNANENTPIVVSMGTSNYSEIIDEINTIKNQYGEDVIIAYISGQDYKLQDVPTWRDEAYQYLRENYNFDGVADVYIAHSNRCGQVLILASDDIKNSASSYDSPSFVLLDGRMSNLDGSIYYGNGYSTNILDDEHLKYLADSNAKMYIYTGGYDENDMENINRFVKSGIDCVIIESGFDHGMQMTGNINNGAIRLALDIDNQLFNLDTYTFKIPSSDSNGNVTWTTYKWSQLSDSQKAEINAYLENLHDNYSIKYNKNGMYNYYSKVDFNDFKGITTSLLNTGSLNKIVSNDEEFVISDMNTLRGYVKNTAMLDNITSIGNCSSTTKIPTYIENVLHDYFSLVTTLLDKITLETQKVVDTCVALTEEEKELQKKAYELASTAAISNESKEMVAARRNRNIDVIK